MEKQGWGRKEWKEERVKRLKSKEEERREERKEDKVGAEEGGRQEQEMHIHPSGSASVHLRLELKCWGSQAWHPCTLERI